MAYESEEQEENVYGQNAREDLVDNDEMDPEEEAFMEGYEDEFDEEEEEDDGDYEAAFEESASGKAE